jgi:chromate transporter
MGTLWHLLVSFGQIGVFALGGGSGMLKLIEEECVENRRWLGAEEFTSLVGATFLFPGLTAVKLSALIGLKVAGLPGLVIAVTALNLPGLLLATAFYAVILTRQDEPTVQKLVTAMQYGALALLAAALWALARPLAGPAFSWQAGALGAGLFVAVAIFNLSPFAGLLVFLAACLALL